MRDASEKEIQRAGCELLRTFGFAVYNLSQARATKQTPGLADTFICGHGVTCWIEWKRPGAKQSPAQVAFENEVQYNGGRYYVFKSVVDVVTWFQDLRRTEDAA